MAVGAADGMALGKREEAVFNINSGPSSRGGFVAFYAVGAVPGQLMVGLCGSKISFTVAVDAFDTERLKPPERTRLMALFAIGLLMGAGQWKPALPVDIADVLNDPGFRGMAAGAIRSERCFMQVIVAIAALALRQREFQRFMAAPAINPVMLANKLEACGVMVECHPLFVYRPSFGGMANRAVDLKALPVGVLPEKQLNIEEKT